MVVVVGVSNNAVACAAGVTQGAGGDQACGHQGEDGGVSLGADSQVVGVDDQAHIGLPKLLCLKLIDMVNCKIPTPYDS